MDEQYDDGPVGTRVVDHSGRGNDLTQVLLAGSPADSLSASTEHHPDQPGHASWVLPVARIPPAAATFVRRTTRPSTG